MFIKGGVRVFEGLKVLEDLKCSGWRGCSEIWVVWELGGLGCLGGCNAMFGELGAVFPLRCDEKNENILGKIVQFLHIDIMIYGQIS